MCPGRLERRRRAEGQGRWKAVKQQLSELQLSFLMIWLVLGTGILFLPFAISRFVVRDAWLTGPFFFIGGAVVVLVIMGFRRMFPGQTMMEGYFTVFGPWFGRAVGLGSLVWLYVTEATAIRQMVLFLTDTLLSDTPGYVMAGLFFIPVVYAVTQGLEAVGRMGEIITPVGVVLVMALSLFSLQYADFHHVQPVLADGLDPVLRATVVPWLYGVELMTVVQIRPAVAGGRIYRPLWVAVVAISVAGLLAETVVTTILGDSRQHVHYPTLEVVRALRVADFLERLDAIYVIGILATMFLKVSVLHYTLATAISQWAGLRHHRSVVVPGAILVWAGSLMLFSSGINMRYEIINDGWGFSMAGGVGLPVAAVVVQGVRRGFGRWLGRSAAG
ncbi:GerAB/ArcD/ProY family transporter [Kyrpidia spormannii]|nr:endospore germination permease [Kyrpidia spormannii]